MVLSILKNSLKQAEQLIEEIARKGIDIDEKPAEISLKFRKNAGRNYKSSLDVCMKRIRNYVWQASDSASDENERKILLKLMNLAESASDSYNERNYSKLSAELKEMSAVCSMLKPKRSADLDFETPKLPETIRSEVVADLEEIKKTYDAKCYRSAVILCGRVLETVLHRKYYETTGVDILEKNPGIGLGKLIAKLSEKNVRLDPGLMQQVHLINQARVFSVHKKQDAFKPTKMQTQAMVLFLIDTINKIFS